MKLSSICVLNLYLFLALLITGCETDVLQDPTPAAGTNKIAKADKESRVITHYGPAQPIAGGVIRALVEVNHAGDVLALGMMVSERAVYNLPHEPRMWTLELPKVASKTPFNHLSFDWNPEGHDPHFIYGLPHFDLHAYTLSMEERMQIGPGDPQSSADINYVAQFMPQDYHPDPTLFTVPMMGMHWLDFNSPEFSGSVFTHTYIMGSYDDKVIFYEPMFTLDFLKQLRGTVKAAIKPYAAVQEHGLYYPTSYSFTYDATRKAFIILLDDMLMR